jgi:hypothetical protein
MKPAEHCVENMKGRLDLLPTVCSLFPLFLDQFVVVLGSIIKSTLTLVFRTMISVYVNNNISLCLLCYINYLLPVKFLMYDSIRSAANANHISNNSDNCLAFAPDLECKFGPLQSKVWRRPNHGRYSY